MNEWILTKIHWCWCFSVVLIFFFNTVEIYIAHISRSYFSLFNQFAIVNNLIRNHKQWFYQLRDVWTELSVDFSDTVTFCLGLPFQMAVLCKSFKEISNEMFVCNEMKHVAFYKCLSLEFFLSMTLIGWRFSWNVV